LVELLEHPLAGWRQFQAPLPPVISDDTADQARVLRQIAALVTPAGPLVVVEYERRNANPWVPYPIPIATLAEVARDAGLGAPTPLASRPSRYSGAIYSAVVRRD